MDKYYWYTVMIAIVMLGLYKITELSFDRLERLQHNSQVVIEK